MIQLSQKVKIILAIVSGVIVVGAGAAIIMPDSVKVKMTYKSQLEDLQEYYEENYPDNERDGFIYSNDKEGNPILFAIHGNEDDEVADVSVLKKSGVKVKTLYRTSVAESSGDMEGIFWVYTDGLFMVGSYDEGEDGADDASLEVYQVSGGKCNKVATYDMGNSKGLCFEYKGDELSIPYDFNWQKHMVFGYCTPESELDDYTFIDPSDYDMDEAEVEENANKLNTLLFGEKYSKSKQVSGFLEAYPVGSPFGCLFYASEIVNVSDGLRESGTSDRVKFTAELMKQYDSCYKKMGESSYAYIIDEFLRWHPENYNYVSDCYYFSADDNEKRKSYFEDIIRNDIKSLSKINDSKRDSKIIKGIMLENAKRIIYESVVPGFTSEDADKLLEKITKEELKTGSIKEEAESYEAFINKCTEAIDELKAADNSELVSKILETTKKELEYDQASPYSFFKKENYYWVANRNGAIKLDKNGNLVSKIDYNVYYMYSIYYSLTNDYLRVSGGSSNGETWDEIFYDENDTPITFSYYFDFYINDEQVPEEEFNAKYSELKGKTEWQEADQMYDDELEEYLEKEISEKAWRPVFEKMLSE